MQIKIDKRFAKDTSKVKDVKLLNRLGLLLKHLKSVNELHEIDNIKRLVGKKNYYRIRLGDHRIGLRSDGNILYIIRFLHRKDIYKYFSDV